MNKICPRCQKNKNIFVRGYCNFCYTTLHRRGDLLSLPKAISPLHLTEIQKNVLTGGLLGDLCLYKQTKKSNTIFQLSRSLKEKDYMFWFYNLFNDFCNVEPITTKKIIDMSIPSVYTSVTEYADDSHIEIIGDNKIYHGLHLSSRTSPVFNSYYDKWYTDKKNIPNDLILNKYVIATWFCDDGSIENTSAPFRFYITFATHSFTKEECYFLAKLLSDRYNEKFSVSKQYNNYRIWAADSGSRELLKDIDDVMPEGMNRKSDKWRNDSARFYNNQPKRWNPKF